MGGLGVVCGGRPGSDVLTLLPLDGVAMAHHPEVDVGLGVLGKSVGQPPLTGDLDNRAVDVLVPVRDGPDVDDRVDPKRPDLVAKAIVPDYALGSHVAALGLTWSEGNTLPAQFANGMFIGQHGSWNRKPRSGYSVVFVPFTAGRPSGPPIDVLTGFVNADGKAYGRPVGVAIDRRGALLVADDVGNIIWRVTSAGAK